eukprot:TRINITY_DN23121_c0_g1_i1.p1 TRINITY_DN23121_c0_g1~~TRINITY_DN23121_c0_g1_i1.p1  ORF type:complete len:268 (+),score=56.15 TRINITY_DN23121_c0_g1_i1:70-873(+)
MVVAALQSPELLRRGLLPFCDTASAFRFLAAASALRGEVGHLQQLDIKFSRDDVLDDDRAGGLAMAIERALRLQRLQVSVGYQALGPCIAEQLAGAVGSLQSLRQIAIELRQNDIGTSGALAWAKTLTLLPHLSFVNLGMGFNQLGSEAVIPLAKALLAAGSLKDLFIELDINRIGDLAAGTMLESAAALSQLENLKLDFAHCGLGDQAACVLAGTMSNGLAKGSQSRLTTVQLDLRGNCFTRAACTELAQASACLESRGCHTVCRT